MRKLLRGIVIAIGVVELALGVGFAAFLVCGTSDPLGSSIARGVALLIGLTLAVLVLPGLLLAWRNRLLPLAAMLVVAAPPLFVYAMAQA